MSRRRKKLIKIIFKKIICLILTFSLVISSIQISVLALEKKEEHAKNEKYFNNQGDMSKVPIDFEIMEKRDKNSKTFRKIDGTYEIAYYGETVHYLNNGNWEDIDNSLSYDANLDEYNNKNNNLKIKLPKLINSNKDFMVMFDNYKLSWSIDRINNSKLIINENETMSEDLRNLKNINQSVVYQNIFDNIDLEYIIKGDILKENIILNQYQSNFSITYHFKLNNLKVVNQNGKIIFINENGKEVFDLGSLYMYDQNMNKSNNISTEIVNISDKEFSLTITPDDIWLSSPDRVYPIIVDPSLTMVDIDNHYGPIREKSTDGWNVDSVDYGMESFTIGGEYKAYLEFDLNELIGYNINYADLELVTYKNSNTCSTCQINAKEILSDFNSISTGNIPESSPTIYDFAIVKSTDPVVNSLYQYYYWDLTRLVQKWNLIHHMILMN